MSLSTYLYKPQKITGNRCMFFPLTKWIHVGTGYDALMPNMHSLV